MPLSKGAHEFVKADTLDVMECRYCGMKAVVGYFGGVETLPCTYGREHLTEE